MASALQEFRFTMGRNLGERMIPILGLKKIVFNEEEAQEEQAEYRYE